MFVGFDGEILMLFGFAFLAEIIAGIFMSLLRIRIFIGCYLMISFWCLSVCNFSVLRLNNLSNLDPNSISLGLLIVKSISLNNIQ
jgi:hypothetical protein